MAQIELRLRTWIPQEKVFLSGNEQTSLYFKGDNRRNATWSTLAYRTSHAFTIDTSKANFGLTQTTKKVSSTTSLLYNNSTGALITSESLTGSTNSLTYSSTVKSDDNLYITVTCDASNPLVTGSPAINYEFVIKVTRAGSVRITGKHDGFPAYELWRSVTGRSTGPELVYTHNPIDTGETVLSLFPPMEHDVDLSLSI